jgi:hypothetical protein
MSELWTGIARCGTCKKEINRAQHVPESDKTKVNVSAPLAAICDVRSHNTGSDYNLNFEIEWIKENEA